MKKNISIVFIFIFLIFVSGCQKDANEETKQIKQEPLKVNVITVYDKKMPLWVRYTGRTKASNKQDIVSRVSGILEKRYVKDGQFVKKNQKLFLIQQDEYKAALDAAKAKLAEDIAALKLAQANVDRYLPLVKEGLAPRATLESYQAQVAKLRASISGDKASIKEAKLNLSYTVIKAPISGKISARRVDVGNVINANSLEILTTIVKINPIYAYFSPSQKDVMMFYKLAMQKKPYAFVEVDSPFGMKRYNGYVDFSDNVVDPLTSTITMRAVINNPRNELLPGTFVYVNIFLTNKMKFLMIPPYVILNDQLGKYLYVVDENNIVQRRDIKTGYRTKYYVSVTKGLKDKDKVIVSSLLKIKRGMKVIPNDVTKDEGIDAVLKKNNLIPKMDK